MSGRRVRWGILSTARIAVRRVLPALLRSETGAAVAVASRERARAQAVADRFGIPRAYGSYDELLADPEVDAVYNPLPNSLHREWTVRAAEAGKHVLCEKPLATSAREAAEMVEACRRAGVLLQEAFMYRFHPQIETLHALVRDGAVGVPWLVRAAFTFTVARPDDIRLTPALGGGGLLDVGCYGVNLSRLLLGEPVAAWATAVYEGGVDVRLAAGLRFPSAAALVDCGLRAPYRQLAEVVGTEGTITLPRPFQPEEDPAILVVRRGDREEQVVVEGTNQYTRMLDHMGRCLLDHTPPRYPPDDAVANMRVLDAVAAAAQTGEAVRLGT